MDILQIKIRLPNDLKQQIEQASKVNKRSLNAEIALRLEQTLKPEYNLAQLMVEMKNLLDEVKD